MSAGMTRAVRPHADGGNARWADILSRQSVQERFWAKVRVGAPDECWEWTRPGNTHGYGQFHAAIGLAGNPHRFAKIWHIGETIPGHLHVDHMCRNRLCVNPAHLRVVPAKVNTLENSVGVTALNARKTACLKGHPFSDKPSSNGYRFCRICANERQRKHTQAKKAAMIQAQIERTDDADA